MFRSNSFSTSLLLALLFSLLTLDIACGVKGPPLPPVPATAAQADQVNKPRPEPSPGPTAKGVQ